MIGNITFTDMEGSFDCLIRGIYKCNGKDVYVTSSDHAFRYRCSPEYEDACLQGEDEQKNFIDSIFIQHLKESGYVPDMGR